MQRGEKFKAIVADTKQRIQEITFDELQQLKQEGQAFHIIDVRESSEWEKEAIPEALLDLMQKMSLWG